MLLLGYARLAPGQNRRRTADVQSNLSALPTRLRTLLWVLAINGALLGIEGIIQRVEGSGNLLFLVKPRVNPGAESQFGPFAYRANASSYFNLAWPVCLGLWYTLQQMSRRKSHHILLFCAAVMAACPVISTSRGGAIITAALTVASALLVLFASFLPSLVRGRRPPHSLPLRRYLLTAFGILVFAGLASGIAYKFGWKSLKPRISAYAMLEGFTVREEMYLRARPMARDYPWFGTGPGTFMTVFQMYRFSTDTYWPAQLHNDWLETRITFGWLGSGLIFLALLCVTARPLFPGGINVPLPFLVFTWLALAGCLAHARYDFPFQMYSILFLFVTLCAMLTAVTLKGRIRESGG